MERTGKAGKAGTRRKEDPAAPISPEEFFLDPEFRGTRQQQIQRLVSARILSGRFRPGAKMPSSRKLAQHLGLSRITVTLAYGELLAGDYLVAQKRSGYFVSKSAPTRAKFETAPKPTLSAVDWSRALGQRYSHQVLPEKPEEWRLYPYRFIYGQGDESLFDHRNWRLCALQALGRKDFHSVTADSFERDDPELVKYIALQTLPRRGIQAGSDEILITLGAQNALWLSAQVLLNQRRTAAMENPGYPGLRAVLQQTPCNLLAASVNDDGLVFEDLPSGVDVVFTTPSHQCPTNVTMPVERRRAFLDHAAANGYIIVEDDYEFEMSFLKSPAPALKSLDHDGRVVYVGSLSKSLFPGLRLGYLVGPEPFIREARALRASVLRHPPGLMQRIAARFLSLGHHDALVARISRTFRARREVMSDALERNGFAVPATDAAGGSSFWIRADEAIDTKALALRVRPRGVLIEPGSVFFDPASVPTNWFRLAYSSVDQTMIPDGIRIIAEEIAMFGDKGRDDLALTPRKISS